MQCKQMNIIDYILSLTKKRKYLVSIKGIFQVKSKTTKHKFSILLTATKNLTVVNETCIQSNI
jgi:hypothetical protein